LGGFDTEDECDDMITEAFNGNGQKALLQTTKQDKQKATSLIKMKNFKQTHDLEFSIAPVKHKKPKDEEEVLE
jgi:hypothetical protein